MYDLEIINAMIVNSTESFRGCISVKDGKIAAITKEPLGNVKRTIDAEGLHLLPGMIDQHVHFMDPGETSREDFITGSSAAAMGGITTVVEHTHSNPVRSVKEFEEKLDHLTSRSLVDYGLTAHVFPEDIGNLKALWDKGVMQFKVFTCTTHGIPTHNNDELFQMMTEVASFGGTVLIHCEDDAITEGNEVRLKNDNREDSGIISEWRSETAEDIAVGNVALMSRLTGANVIIAHVSHPFVIELIKREQEEGAKIYAEICPQYLFLDEKNILEKGAFGKFTPPARSAAQGAELVSLINNGSITLLSSDHAPSTVEQKLSKDIWECNFGLPGVETTLMLMLDLVNNGEITLNRLVELYSETPAKILGIYPKKGSLRPGTDADFTLVDLNQEWEIKNENVVSKAGWSPYDGKKGKGKACKTIVRGNVIMDNGKILAEPGTGNAVLRK